MALLYGAKFIHQSAVANRPHILGFQTARSAADDTLFEVWNAATVAGIKAAVDKDGKYYSAALTAGDILYGVTGGVANVRRLDSLAIGAVGKVLRSDGSIPAWSTATIPDTAVQGDLLHASAANVWSSLAKGAARAVLQTNAGATLPEWTAALSITDLTVSNTITGAITGLAGSATILATARDINGVAFDGSTNITVTAAADTLTGGPVAAAQGGTAFTTWTKGDILYASATDTLAQLGIGGAGDIVTVVAGVPAWSPAGSPGAHVLATTAGLGSSHTTSGLTAGQVLRATAATTAAFQALIAADIPALDTAKVTTGTWDNARVAESNVTQHQTAITEVGTLVSGSTWNAQVIGAAYIGNLATSKITSGTFDDARIAESNVTQHQGALSIGQAQISDTVAVTRGGTGVVSPTSGNLLVGATASAMTLLAPGAAAGYVRSNGSAWVRASGVAAADLTGTSLPVAIVTSSLTSVGTLGTGTWAADSITPAYGGTGVLNPTVGNLLIGAGASAMTELAPGAAGGYVRSNGTAWVRNTIQAGDLPAHTHDADTGLTGATLASTVLASSLTSVGTLATLTVTAQITGSISGASTSCSGNAATATLAADATTLETPRNINGVSFDGSSNITVAAAAGTLTGATLAAGVTASSLTSVAQAAVTAHQAALAIAASQVTAAAFPAGEFDFVDVVDCNAHANSRFVLPVGTDKYAT